jgi:hypothetical protein
MVPPRRPTPKFNELNMAMLSDVVGETIGRCAKQTPLLNYLAQSLYLYHVLRK